MEPPLSRRFRARASRARALAARHPEARETLGFYAELASFQAEVRPDSPLSSLTALVALVDKNAPPLLRAAAREIDEATCRNAIDSFRSGRDIDSLQSFFARVLLQASMNERECPAHRTLPQTGCLKPEGHGTALTLVCAICLGEWAQPRGTCFGCGESDEKSVVYYETPELPFIRVQMCQSCQRYIHIIRLDVEPEAIPDVDEIAALSLDVWARERGYRKLVPNLVGI